MWVTMYKFSNSTIRVQRMYVQKITALHGTYSLVTSIDSDTKALKKLETL